MHEQQFMQDRVETMARLKKKKLHRLEGGVETLPRLKKEKLHHA